MAASQRQIQLYKPSPLVHDLNSFLLKPHQTKHWIGPKINWDLLFIFTSASCSMDKTELFRERMATASQYRAAIKVETKTNWCYFQLPLVQTLFLKMLLKTWMEILSAFFLVFCSFHILCTALCLGVSYHCFTNWSWKVRAIKSISTGYI